MLIALAPIAPIVMTSSVRFATSDGRCPVNAPVGSASAFPPSVTEAAPTICRTVQPTKMPSAADTPAARGLVPGGR